MVGGGDGDVLRHVGVRFSAQFPTAQQSLAPNLPAILVSMTGKNAIVAITGDAMCSEDGFFSW